MDYAEVLRDLETQFLAQLEREPAKGNSQVPGDVAVKQKLYALLGRAQLRRFFAAAVDGRHLSRIRSLFGAPPTYFINTAKRCFFAQEALQRARTWQAPPPFLLQTR